MNPRVRKEIQPIEVKLILLTYFVNKLEMLQRIKNVAEKRQLGIKVFHGYSAIVCLKNKSPHQAKRSLTRALYNSSGDLRIVSPEGCRYLTIFLVFLEDS